MSTTMSDRTLALISGRRMLFCRSVQYVSGTLSRRSASRTFASRRTDELVKVLVAIIECKLFSYSDVANGQDEHFLVLQIALAIRDARVIHVTGDIQDKK